MFLIICWFYMSGNLGQGIWDKEKTHMQNEELILKNHEYLKIRPVARKGYGSIAHEAKPNGLLIGGPWGRRV